MLRVQVKQIHIVALLLWSISAISASTAHASNTSAASATAASSTVAKPAVSWSLESLNNAVWYDNIGRGQFPVYAKAQVMLNNAHASPGAIDGTSGKNFLKALSAYQQMRGFEVSGELTQQTWHDLLLRQKQPVFTSYQITAEDLKGPYVKSIPRDYAQQAKMSGLYYTRVSEMLSEKFHIDEAFLRQLNPKANFNKVGQSLVVPNSRNELPGDVSLIVAHKSARQLYLFNNQHQMIGAYPATIGAANTPSPKGTHEVVKVARNPVYGYSPKNFVQGNNKQALSLPPGPNGPVGNIWIGLSKPSFGIHGTPNPSLISKTASHGCIRLTNWDANALGAKVTSGVKVKFID